MKIALLALSLFLLAFSSSAFVVDTDGNLMYNGGSYYILPVLRGKGGGLGLAKTGNETCPISVVQSRSETNEGLPVRIASPYRILNIYEGLPLTLAYTAVPTCADTPSEWTVVENLSAATSVKLSGFYNNSSKGWFNIQRYANDYKLTFCPLNSATATCGDIGVNIDENGVRELVLDYANGPLLVMFKKATESSAKLPSHESY